MKHSFISHLLVFCQFTGVALSCFPFSLPQRGPIWVLFLCLLGAALGIAALAYNKVGNFSVYPEIKKRAKLIMRGPYRFIRHPMYTALILMMAGIAIYNGHWLNVIGWALVVLAVSCKAAMEELYLVDRFPEYMGYRERTKKFFPWLL